MKMLVVVDYQKDFVDGALGFPGAELPDAGIAAKIDAYARAGDFVVQTMDTHQPDYLNTREGKHLPVPHCIAGTAGWETYGQTAGAVEKLAQSPCFHRIDKVTFGVHPRQMQALFARLEARQILPESVEQIEFVGLVSNICVISNVCVFQGAFPNAQIVVDPGLIASHDPQAHEAVLTVLRGLQVEFL